MEEFNTLQIVWDTPKEVGDTLSFSVSPTLTSYTALIEFAVGMEDGIFMMQDDCSIDLMGKRIIPLWDDSFIHRSGWRPLMLTLTQLGRFLFDENFSWEANFKRTPSLFKHEKLHDGHGSIFEDEFGMGDVKVVGNNMRGA